jgi:flagellar biosynthesis/type III secretory pathway protein FliH
MSYHIVLAGNGHMVGATSPLIKKAEREAFVDATSLLRRANAIGAEVDASAETARLRAAQQGYAEGAAMAEVELETARRHFADATAQIEEHYAQQVAEAAYAATVAIIGELEDDQLVRNLVSQVLAKQKQAHGLSVHVSPELQPPLGGLFDTEDGSIAVVANPDLGPTECHIMTANGRIIASLPVQLAVLRERWGLESAEEER